MRVFLVAFAPACGAFYEFGVCGGPTARAGTGTAASLRAGAVRTAAI